MKKTYTKVEILELVKELKEEEKKTMRVPHYYVRNGEVRERQYPDYVHTERYEELFGESSPLRTEKVFKCEDCGSMVSFFELESWCCDFEEDEYICSCCYEDEMGEDL